jgi:CBS domain-containing protein
MKRIHIPNMGPKSENIPIAVAVAIREAKTLGSDAITLITPVKDNLDSIVLGDFLGRDVAKRLMKGGTVALGNCGVSLTHESTATMQKKHRARIGLAFYVSKDSILQLDQLEFECLIFVPWLDKEGVEWAQKWNAETNGAPTTGAEVNLPKGVITALKSLTARVNLSNGLGHPSDKDHAKHTFLKLQSAGIKWDPTEIETWAVRNGWRADDAQELAMLSGRYT